MTVGNRIRFARKYRNMTSRGLGERLGFDYPSAHVRISQYEHDSKKPKDETIQRLAEVLNTNKAYFDDCDPANIDDVMRFIFELDRLYGLRIIHCGQGVVCFDLNDQRLEQRLNQWLWKRSAMNDEEFIEYIFNYPDGDQDGYKD